MIRFWHTLAIVIAILAVPAISIAVRDGSGGYSLPSNAFSDPVTGGTLTASDAVAVWSDLETAIAGSVAADGQTTMTGNLKMGSNKITGLTTGSANTDSVTLGQVQNSGMKWGGVAGGTADALTIALSPVITAYADGQSFCFTSSASPNTTTATLNVNSVGAKTIKKNGAALIAGEIAASQVYCVTYYSNEFHLWSGVPAHASTVGVHKLWIPVAAMRPATTNGPASADVTGTDVQYYTLDFDQTTAERAHFNISMPSSWNEGTVTFIPVWTAASGTGGVNFQLHALTRSNDDAIAGSYVTGTASEDTLIATGDLHRGPESSALTIEGTAATNDTIFFRITRAVNAAGDTLTADARLIGIELYITTDAATDAP